MSFKPLPNEFPFLGKRLSAKMQGRNSCGAENLDK